MDNIKPIPPFKRFCGSLGAFPEAFSDAMTVYEALEWLYRYLNKTILPAINKDSEQIEALTLLVTEIKEYVDHYFDNLDVQEEINNKLDEMAESGELATIMAAFVDLNPIFTFDTLADMVSAEYLISGCSCQTLGKATLNDGYGAIYKIDTTGDIHLDNGLYATMKGNTQGNNYINEITITRGRANHADYNLATIPLNDNEGNLINCYVNEDETSTISPLQYADQAHTTLTLNAGLGRLDSEDHWKQGAVIANGEILHGDLCDIPPTSFYSYIGIKADRTVVNFAPTTSPETIIAQGVQNAFLTFGQYIINGVIHIHPDADSSERNPWIFLGVTNTNTMLILSTDGRSDNNIGMTLQEVCEFMLSLGCYNAWRLDGGGSSSMVYKGSKQNRNVDQNRTKDRGIWVTLNFKKDTIDQSIADVYSFLGEQRQLLNKQIRDDSNAEYETKKAYRSYGNRPEGVNVIAVSDTEVNMKFEGSYRNATGDSALATITDENNHFVGVTFQKPGIYKIDWMQVVKCSSTSGRRGLILTKSDGSQYSGFSRCYDTFNPAGANEVHCMTAVFSINVTQEGTEMYFKIEGKQNDDFTRGNLTITEIGIAL